MKNIAKSPATADCTLGPLGRFGPSRARPRWLMMWAAGLTPVVPSLDETGPWRGAQETVLVRAVKDSLD
jgi:hypothetical protein